MQISRAQPASPARPPAEVVHRGNIEIFSLEDYKKFQNVTKVIGNLTLEVRGEKLSLPNLKEVQGDVNFASDKAIELDNLKSVSGSIGIAGSPTLTRVVFPRLETVGRDMWVSSASYPLPKMTELDLCSLKQIGNLGVANSGLRKLNLPKLQSVGDLSIKDNKLLAALTVPALKTAEFRVEFTNNPKHPSAALRALARQLRDAGIDPAKIFTGN